MPKYESVVDCRPHGRLYIRIPDELFTAEEYPFSRECAEDIYFNVVPGNESALEAYKLTMFGADAPTSLKNILLLPGEVMPFANKHSRSSVLRVPESSSFPFSHGDRVCISVVGREIAGFRIEKIG
ncbi:MAG: hypothetical protein ABIA12_02155 [Candidatus Aenigmatarchaeota archaeon]